MKTLGIIIAIMIFLSQINSIDHSIKDILEELRKLNKTE